MTKKFSFVKTAKDYAKPKSLKYLLHSHLSGYQKERSLANIHASDLTKAEGFCPRYFALHDATDTPRRDSWLSAADVVTYRMGNDLQDQVVEGFADMGRAVGHWECRGCANMSYFNKRPVKCTQCGCKTFRPREVRFESSKSGASCGIDMLADLGEPKLVITEIKTMIKDQFVKLLAPLSEHRLRTNLYLRIVAESNHTWASMVNTQKARVLYVCKGGYIADPELAKMGLADTYSPFKEFDISRDDSATDSLEKGAIAISEYRAGTKGMPCGICTTSMVPRAKTCAMRKACFSGDYPPENDWTGDK